LSGAIADLMKEGVATGVFPGGVLLVEHRGRVVFHRAYGRLSRTGPPSTLSRITCATLFDLASLTKPLATAAAILLLIQNRSLRLDDPVCKRIPSFRGERKEEVTLFHLLNHSSGLPAWKDYRGVDGRQDLYCKIHVEPLISRPGERNLYSDLGFILLGETVERVSNLPLDRFFDRQIAPPAKCKTAGFTPPLDGTLRFAATAALPKEGVLQGWVDDDNARAAGGVAGHAGLFATARDVHCLLRLWTDSLAGHGPFDPDLTRRFVRPQTQASTWGLGWDTPSRVASSSGRFFSAQSFGHLGFTGTSIWVDPKQEMSVILLTNRVHPDRSNTQIKRFRPILHDTVFREVIG
jgi:CubicO group peptidase (beta-lactamase class C family)